MAKSDDPSKKDAWDSAPETNIIPFMTAAQRAVLVNERTEITITAMDYDGQGRFGPKFVATFTTPDGDILQYSFPSHPSRPTPRDYTNKWIREQVKAGNVVEAVFCKSGGSYFLGKPGSESERDSIVPVVTSSAESVDVSEPPF